jgi:hypothetical protein
MTLHSSGKQVHHHEAALRDSEVEIGRLAHHGGIDGPSPLHRDGHGSVAGFLAVTEYDQEATTPDRAFGGHVTSGAQHRGN